MDDIKKVFEALEEERVYQNNLPHHSEAMDNKHAISDWIIFIENHLEKAKKYIYELDEGKAMHEVRKISALGVACMQHQGIYKRK